MFVGTPPNGIPYPMTQTLIAASCRTLGISTSIYDGRLNINSCPVQFTVERASLPTIQPELQIARPAG